MEKLKSRLDAFADAIMAVIITIMVLDIAPIMKDSWPRYLAMGKHIGIYLITFVFIFNMWYQHSTAFAEIATMTYRILVWEVLFLAVLSLMPLFTSMMAENTTRITVMLYGLMQAVINFIFRLLAKAIIHQQYTAKADMQQVYQKIYGNANHPLAILSVIAIVVAYFLPHLAVLFYLAYPILNFLLNADARQQMFDAEALPDDQQKDLAALPASAYVDWRKAARQILAKGEDPVAPAAGEPQADEQPGPAAPQNAAPMLPEKWADWLDQNVDARRRQVLVKRYEQANSAQQQRMAQWFDQRRKGRPHGHTSHHDHH
ncbi:TMEM175 family protein [Lacticaseibacillus jixianensis]|uniref:TMEM175 family protein n=1 Tax=Lacticaseibacillus jixianensis TaxID=2486012 RepID=A0ABW4BA42_9LACO|nr:TMEM175 family protein [Lacticaseibacillus jixianensis]